MEQLEPIIQPIWFYLINIVSVLKPIAASSGLLMVVIPLCLWFAKSELTKALIKVIILGGIITLLSALIPSEQTIYNMLFASIINKVNFEDAEQIIKSIIESTRNLMSPY